MSTRQEILEEIAKKYPDNKELVSLMLAIRECKQEASMALSHLSNYTGLLQSGLEGVDGRSVPYDSSEVVVLAAKANASLTSLSKYYLSLAAALQRQGEEINY